MTTAVVQKLALRAKQADEIIAQLRAQIELVRKTAAISVSKPEEERLCKENASLKEKIAQLKTKLILTEIKNGVKQVPLPMRKAKVSLCTDKTSTQAPPAVEKANTATKPEKQDKAKKEAVQNPADGASKAKKTKAGGGGGGGAAAAADDRPVDISRLDLRVGKIVGVKKHPDADSLYVEDVDLGEGQTRTIVSGLVKHVTLEQMQDRLAVFMCNLKPAKMRGIMSQGMIMCASSPEKVEILIPPATAQIGDRVQADGYTDEPDAMLNPKKKIWETIKPDLKTDANKVAAYKGAQLSIKGKGLLVAPTLSNTQIS